MIAYIPLESLPEEESWSCPLDERRLSGYMIEITDYKENMTGPGSAGGMKLDS